MSQESQSPNFFYSEVTDSAWKIRAQEEQEDLRQRCVEELEKAIGDGGWKLMTNKKVVWHEESVESHEKSMFSHLYKWKAGQDRDEDSRAHPLVHLAARALILALIESGNVPEKKNKLQCFNKEPHASHRWGGGGSSQNPGLCLYTCSGVDASVRPQEAARDEETAAWGHRLP